MSRAFIVILILTGLTVSGRGNRPGERAASGGLIGAGAGAGIAAIAGGPILGGALLGGAVGAAGGAVTAPSHR